ncbi:MAG: DMT family transporter [Flavobacteriaceae bacterium]
MDQATSLRLAPVMAVVGSIAVLSGMDAMIKGYGTGMFVVQIIFLRMLFGAAAGAGMFLASGPHKLTRKAFSDNLLRGFVMLFAGGGFFYAITVMPLMEAVTISFVAPIFVVLLARPILGEPVTANAVIAVGVGFAGVGIIASAGFSSDKLNVPGVLAALGSAFMYALGLVLLRHHSRSHSVPVLVFVQNTLMLCIVTPIGLWFWEPVEMETMAGFCGIGMLAIAGHCMMAWAFSRAEAGKLAPIEYTNLVFAGLLGWIFFAEVPPVATVFGALLIALACWLANRPGRMVVRAVQPGKRAAG